MIVVHEMVKDCVGDSGFAEEESILFTLLFELFFEAIVGLDDDESAEEFGGAADSNDSGEVFEEIPEHMFDLIFDYEGL